ncbi:hypothetical protein ACJ2A9_12030 [Anaerobacillus sp. MEB173]|uniref:hypothetical protein n=1 Tax=Anaerobacillus sp. MEB173 TaxID=3383345 RepID=UPI003F8FECCD
MSKTVMEVDKMAKKPKAKKGAGQPGQYSKERYEVIPNMVDDDRTKSNHSGGRNGE